MLYKIIWIEFEMVLAIDGDLSLSLFHQREIIREGWWGWRRHLVKSEFLGWSSYPIVEIEKGRKFQSRRDVESRGSIDSDSRGNFQCLRFNNKRVKFSSVGLCRDCIDNFMGSSIKLKEIVIQFLVARKIPEGQASHF